MFSLSPLSSLPRYSGPYHVGSTEFEIPISQIDAKASSPDSRITTLKFRLFYPTDSAPSARSITWIPSPQRQWVQAFSTFLGASMGWSSFVNPILSMMNFITLPATANPPLRQEHCSSRRPLAIFSHGLAGNCNMYSAICGSLASCGVICAAIEHRDGSSPVSWIRGPGGEIESEILYRRYSHSPTAEVFNGRNSQLRIRLWEIDLLYAALRKLDDGHTFSNYASDGSSSPSFMGSMDFEPGHVSWLGHSFGAATITQFVKSVYYHEFLPTTKPSTNSTDHDWTPLYTASDSQVAQQITPSSPVALLDVWTLPFRAPSTQWLWERPLPCYHRAESSVSKPNTVAIMSTEFYNYLDLRKRTQAVLSFEPARAERQLTRDSIMSGASAGTERPASSPTISTPPHKGDPDREDAPLEPDALPGPAIPVTSSLSVPLILSPSSSRDPSPVSVTHLKTFSPSASPSSSQTSLSVFSQEQDHDHDANHDEPQSETATSKPVLPTTSSTSSAPPPSKLAPKLFHVPFSAHLSQSDFGLLFPALTRVLMKAVDPQGTISLNIRGITAAMRNAGLDVRRIDEPRSARRARKRQSSSSVATRDQSRGRSTTRKSWFWGRREGKSTTRGERADDVEEDRILSGDKDVKGTRGRWVEIPLVF